MPQSLLAHLSSAGGFAGDIGSIDADGFLTLHGRKNDLINRGGEKISPVEIDQVLLQHAAVAEAAAFPVRIRVLVKISQQPLCSVLACRRLRSTSQFPP